MGMTSTVGYDIWSEDAIETPIKLPSIHKWGETLQTPSKLPNTYIWGETLRNPLSDPTSTYGGRHFKPQDTDLNEPTKIAHIIRGETLQTPIFGDRQPDRSLE